jgi:hypothetical protein
VRAAITKIPDDAWVTAIDQDGGSARDRNPPFRDFEHNRVWLEIVRLAHDLIVWTQHLLLTGELAKAEPKRLRYRLLHVGRAPSLSRPHRHAAPAGNGALGRRTGRRVRAPQSAPHTGLTRPGSTHDDQLTSGAPRAPPSLLKNRPLPPAATHAIVPTTPTSDRDLTRLVHDPG